jgi:hypothetical protein
LRRAAKRVAAHKPQKAGGRSTRVRQAVLAVSIVLLLAGCADSDPDGPEDASGDDGAGGDGGPGRQAEAGILSGTLTAVGSSTSQPIDIRTAGHQRLSAMLVLTSNLPQTSIGLNVSGPDGRSDEVRTGPTLYVLPGGHPAVSFGDPTVGDWTATVELRSGARADYEVHWCADDVAAPGPQDNLACQRTATS